jgi:hypothetical protein
MAEGIVRVEQRIGARKEVTNVSAQHVEEYLATHPGSRALDKDWRAEAAKVEAAETRAERLATSEKDKK